jgi:hypothetical protein
LLYWLQLYHSPINFANPFDTKYGELIGSLTTDRRKWFTVLSLSRNVLSAKYFRYYTSALYETIYIDTRDG